jgi:hypothetical protein
MRIAILVEGRTETAFEPHLRAFLRPRLPKRMPKLDFVPYDGRIPTGAKLKRAVGNLLANRRTPADAVIALTDVYTGSRPPDFETAAEAKQKMREWVGQEPRFHPHVALHDFEAWLLPYWPRITQLTGSNHQPTWTDPEQVNHTRPPAVRLAEEFQTGPRTRRSYVKTRDAGLILANQDLATAIDACRELKAFVNTILSLCDESAVIP